MTTRGYPITKRIREKRRAKAEAMKAEYDKLSTEEKLARLPKDGAKKQRARLEALLVAEKNKPSPKEKRLEEDVENEKQSNKKGSSK